MPITYHPTFQHQEWVDNVDRVQAGGDNGFNIRFNTIEADFQALSRVVQDIDTALSSLGEVVSAPITMGLTPVLVPFGANPEWSPVQWSRTVLGEPQGTYVEKPTSAEAARGVLPLNLPHGVTLINLKVLGEQDGGGEVTTRLFQESRSAPFDRLTLVEVIGFGDPDREPTPIPGDVTFDGATNLYYLLAEAEDAADSTIRLRGFQLTYQP